MGRVLGLDVGDKRIGVALSDETRLIASPYCVIQSVGWGPDSRKIADIMRETGAELIVSGLPYNMDGSLGFQAKKVQDFLKVVEGLGFRVEWIDERLTTVSAQNALIEGGMRREDRRNHVDKVAAAVILQTWLDKEREKKEQPMADNEKNLRMEEGGENDNELPEIIELTDDDGNVTRFEYMTTIDYQGELYVALMLRGKRRGRGQRRHPENRAGQKRGRHLRLHRRRGSGGRRVPEVPGHGGRGGLGIILPLAKLNYIILPLAPFPAPRRKRFLIEFKGVFL